MKNCIWTIVSLNVVDLYPNIDVQEQKRFKNIIQNSFGILGCSFSWQNTLFFQLVSYPLKHLTPESTKQPSDAIVVASAGVHKSGAPTPGSTLRAHAAAKLYLKGAGSACDYNRRCY
ncbi:MAG: hypothetical protein CM1200mP30_26670 [Pseudomonadota bacterium]|nr:MAG: hypothetical protein CM1200mP30_26670 [Pseudomonadota bacterium]